MLVDKPRVEIRVGMQSRYSGAPGARASQGRAGPYLPLGHKPALGWFPPKPVPTTEELICPNCQGEMATVSPPVICLLEVAIPLRTPSKTPEAQGGVNSPLKPPS
jgi:hypothetical protein